MLKHTPGPWRIGSLASYDGYTGKPFRNVWVGEEDDSVCIARAIDHGDVDANALLITAAPDMFDALAAYLTAQRRMLERWADGDRSVKSELWKALHACEAAAVAALAKAEGGS